MKKTGRLLQQNGADCYSFDGAKLNIFPETFPMKFKSCRRVYDSVEYRIGGSGIALKCLVPS